MSNDGYNFLIAEYNNLKAEIISINTEMRHLFELSITMCSAFWAWILAKKDDNLFLKKPLKNFTILLFIVCFIIGLFVWALYRDTKHIGDYIQHIEQEFLKDVNAKNIISKDYFVFGWEKNINGNPKDTVFFILFIASWVLQLILNLLGFVYIKRLKTEN